MPETVRTYTTEHRTVYTQKIITDGAGKITSESWMKGSKALKGVYIFLLNMQIKQKVILINI